MPRSVKQVQDALERKKAQIIELEAAVVSAEASEKAKLEARLLDHQALTLGRALLAPGANKKVEVLRNELLDTFSDAERKAFEILPPPPVRTPRAAKREAEAPKPVDPPRSPPAAA